MAENPENLQKYEELFAHRFSSEDHEYQQYLSRPADPPPIVEDWWNRGGGNYRGGDNRYHDRHGHRGRGWGGGRGWRGDQRWGGDRGWRGDHHRQQHGHDRDRDRNLGHGSGCQSGPPSSSRDATPIPQRPHND